MITSGTNTVAFEQYRKEIAETSTMEPSQVLQSAVSPLERHLKVNAIYFMCEEIFFKSVVG
jgi:hypothetical protein